MNAITQKFIETGSWSWWQIGRGNLNRGYVGTGCVNSFVNTSSSGTWATRIEVWNAITSMKAKPRISLFAILFFLIYNFPF